MVHFHPQSPDYPCPAPDTDSAEDLAAYRAAEAAGYDPAGYSTLAAWAIYQRWREGDTVGKHWRGPRIIAPPQPVSEQEEAADRAFRERVGRHLHQVRDHAYGPPCHCTPALGSTRLGLLPSTHLNCATCAAWWASLPGRTQLAYLRRTYPKWQLPESL